MKELLHNDNQGELLYTPSIDEMVVKEQAYLLIENGKVKAFYDTLPEEYRQEKVIDYGEAIIIPAFNDVHIHAPQLINRGVGFDKELLPWLETYTFPVEAKYKDVAFAEKAYKLF